MQISSKAKSGTLGSYQLGSTIGQGTFGKVKIARHLLTNQQVAIKIFQKQRIQKSGQLKRVLQQIKILKEMNHPNIVQMYEIIQTPDKIHIVMQYIQKGELFSFIKLHKKIQEKIAAKMFFQLISIIQYLQKHNITHRDIKPQNILLTDRLSLKLADFGLSNYYVTNQKLTSSCGSPCYALPEMLIGQSYDPKSADIWSSGVVLFTMVCGYLPFQDNDIPALYKKISKQPLQFSSDTSSDLKDLLNCILNKSIQKRYNLQQIKYHKWLVKHCKINYNPETNKNIPNSFIVKQLLNQMQLYGIDSSYATYCLDIRKHNFVTTLYYLLKRKSQRQPNFKFINGQSTCVSIKQRVNQIDELMQTDSSIPAVASIQNNSKIQQFESHINIIEQQNGMKKKKDISKLKSKKSNSIHQNQKKSQISLDKQKKITQNSQNSLKKCEIQTPKSKKSTIKVQLTDQYYLGKTPTRQKIPKKKTSIYESLDSQNKTVCKQYEQIYENKNKRSSRHNKEDC